MASRRLEKISRRRRRNSRPVDARGPISQIESLEDRRLMSADGLDVDACGELTLDHGAGCCCPGCQTIETEFGELTVASAITDDDGNFLYDGFEVDSLPEVMVGAELVEGVVGSGDPELSEAGLVVPILNSNLGASATLYLDFDGHFESSWGGYSNITTRAYDIDGDETTFSSSEVSRMTEIWARVAEDFAPFDINVTTVEPGSFGNGQALRVAIGGSASDWYGGGAGGVAYINSFTNSIANTVYVFEDNLANGNARYVAEAASHEAGHGFGLRHQSEWNGDTKVSEYWTGENGWAPIMGVGYYQTQTTWYDGRASSGSYQDDLSILAGSNNGFGYRSDDHGSSNGSASTVSFDGSGNFSVDGIVERGSDVDVFEFNLDSGTLALDVDVAQYGANLDVVLELYNSNGTLVASANPSSMGASITTSLSAGTYYLHVQSDGMYGSLGQYTLSGSAVPGGGGGGGSDTVGPEVSVSGPGGAITDGQGSAISFGSVATDATAPTVTFTVTNDGDEALSTSGLNVSGGFSIVEGLSSQIAVGASDTFTIRMNTSSAGSKTGTVSFSTNDSDEATFNFNVSGTVTVATDAYENNDTKSQVDNQAAGGTNSANLGVLTDVTSITGLSMDDSADWFRFEMDGTGSATDYVRINFFHSQGDLDLVVYAANGSTEIGRSTSASNSETVSLAGAGAGVYYVRVYGYNGASNPSYSLTIDPAKSDRSFGGNDKVQFVDADGDQVTVSMRGAGTGEITYDGDGNIESIVVSGSDDGSAIVVRSSGVTEVHDVVINGSARTLDLRGVEVTGDISATGSIGRIRIDTIAAATQQTITVGSSGAGDNTRIDILSAADVSIVSDVAIRSIKVGSWSDSLGAADTITAPSVMKLAAQGDFAAGLDIDGDDSGYAIKTAKVSGAVSGDWVLGSDVKKIAFGSSTGAFGLDVDGEVRGIKSGGDLGGDLAITMVRSIKVSGDWTADLTTSGIDTRGYSVKTIRATTMSGGSINASGGIGNVKVSGDIGANISAAWISSIKATGDTESQITLTGIDTPVGSEDVISTPSTDIDTSVLGPALQDLIESAAADLDAMFHDSADEDADDPFDPSDVLRVV